MFYYLFGWEMRHLHTGGSCPVVSGRAGVCDYDQFWSLAGRVAQSAEAMPNFSFCYVTSRKKQLFCAPILYRYIIIKLYNNTTIFSSLLPICVFASGAPGPPRPLAGKDCASRKKCHLFFPPH